MSRDDSCTKSQTGPLLLSYPLSAAGTREKRSVGLSRANNRFLHVVGTMQCGTASEVESVILVKTRRT